MSENAVETSVEEVQETPVEETQEEITSEELDTIEEVEQQEEKQLLRKLQLKIDGKEYDEELPFDLPPEHAEWMKKQLQLAKVSQKRMQESAEDRKGKQVLEEELREFVIALKENPKAVLSDPRLGLDLKLMAQEIMNQELEEASKSPEQKEQESRDKELEDLRQKLQEQELARKTSEQQRLEDEMARDYETQVIDSIEQHGLQKDPRVIKRYAEAMKAGLKYKIQLTPSELGPIIKQQMYEEARFYTNQLQDEELDDFLGKDRISRVRKNMIAKLRKKLPSKQRIKDTGAKELDKETIDPFAKRKPYKKSKDFFKNLKKNI